MRNAQVTGGLLAVLEGLPREDVAAIQAALTASYEEGREAERRPLISLSHESRAREWLKKTWPWSLDDDGPSDREVKLLAEAFAEAHRDFITSSSWVLKTLLQYVRDEHAKAAEGPSMSQAEWAFGQVLRAGEVLKPSADDPSLKRGGT